ncbi:MAG: hypothetical protein M3462_02655 [Chloroflexota bacterium]|nr:hypothetical protein [Chloroflexota bacterium]
MPTLEQLDAALARSSRSVPAIARLGGGTVPQTDAGQPWRVVGNDAVVYQLRQPSGRVLALRCPLSDTFDQRQADRFRGLAALPAAAPRGGGRDRRLPLAGSLAYVEDGVSLAGSDLRSSVHPVVAMDWVMGPTLLSATDRACRANDRPYLAALADAWRDLVAGLDEAGFAHGDLAADNVLIESGGRIVLVDYDTCAWSGADFDITTPGTAGYAHPRFDPRVSVRYRDAFASLVIYVALRALAIRPDLRQRGGDGPTAVGGALLFSAADLANPEGSTIFGLLRGLGQPAVEALGQALRQACRNAPAAVPTVEEWGRLADEAGRVAAKPRPGGGGRAAAPREFSGPMTAQRRQELVTRLNSLLLTGDEESAHRYWYRSGLHDDETSRVEIGPRMADLERRRAIRLVREAAGQRDTLTFLGLWEANDLSTAPGAGALASLHAAALHRREAAAEMAGALRAGDAARVAELWPSVRGDTLVSGVAIEIADTLQRHFGQAVAAALRDGDDAAIVDAVREAEAAGVAPSPSTRKASREARARLRTRAALAEAIARDDRETLAGLALSGSLDDIGPLDRTTGSLLNRALAWPALARALTADDDAALRAAWDEGLFGDDPRLGAEGRERVERSLHRQGWLETVRDALRHRKASVLSEALRDVPTGAADRLSGPERRRLDRVAGRDLAAARLAEALATGDPAAVQRASDEVAALGGSVPELLDWAGVAAGNERDALTRALRDISRARPTDHLHLARLVVAARAVTATEDGIERQISATFQRQAARVGYLHHYRDAIAANDPEAIAAVIAGDQVGAIEVLDGAERATVADAMARVGASETVG